MKKRLTLEELMEYLPDNQSLEIEVSDIVRFQGDVCTFEHILKDEILQCEVLSMHADDRCIVAYIKDVD